MHDTHCVFHLGAWTRRVAAVALTLAAACSQALAQGSYPDRTVTLLVPFGVGGIADVTARAVTESMSKTLGQTVIVDNKPSAGSIVASQAVAKARPDGYTLLLMSNGNAVSVNLFKKLPYDTVEDFQLVSTLGFFDLGVFASAKSKYGSLKQALAAARAEPGKLTIGTIAVGSTQHLAAKLFQTQAGIDVLLVPYKTSPALQTALIGGEVDLAIEIVGPMLPQVRGGTVKALAVTGDERNPTLPNVPTVQESGLAQYSVASWNAIAVPKGTPAPVVERLNQAIREALASPPVQATLGAAGMRYRAGTPEQARELLVNDIKRWGEVIRQGNIKLE
ncbi:tripartite tricarboxylate transporter substrate binding protein [Schlegelella sp. S2-27]|uniref:Tripartite tricarboxylate transporter substrate binding protein n=1 Tax=Caldimonas mangrovi TaxID=2944811 RepID=A0ABT0YT91_9BURK|nr:tripartite tricarboxylate transporter substrate binding protein [Caldimonas mangrovi]MCM5681838.1 tripartite tricarboxylate transporter substrate binding protein [Caldimonas mangrovi]